MSIFNVILIMSWGVFWAYWFISALQSRTENKRQEPFVTRFPYWILLVISFGLLIFDLMALGPVIATFSTW